MRRRKRICPWCQSVFISHPRLKDRQRSCGFSRCKDQQKYLSHRLWKKKERGVYLQGLEDWRKAHPQYWREYRAGQPDYVLRNRNQSRIRKHFARMGLQKRIDILQVTEKQMEFWDMGRFAKECRSLVPLLYAMKRRHELVAGSSP